MTLKEKIPRHFSLINNNLKRAFSHPPLWFNISFLLLFYLFLSLFFLLLFLGFSLFFSFSTSALSCSAYSSIFAFFLEMATIKNCKGQKNIFHFISWSQKASLKYPFGNFFHGRWLKPRNIWPNRVSQSNLSEHILKSTLHYTIEFQ